MKQTRLVMLLLVIMALVVLAACQQDEQPTPVPAATAVSEASPVDDVNTRAVNTGVGAVGAEGQVVPLRSADLSFELGGTVAEILAPAGSEVMLGDPIVQLDAGTLENALLQAQAGLASAEAGLQAAQARLTVAESGVQGAEAGRKAAEAQLALTKAGATPEELAAAQENLAAAEAAIVQAAGNRDSAVRVSDASVQAAQAQLAQAQANADSLQQAYDDIIDACFKLPNGEEVCPLYGPVEENTRAQLAAAQANVEAAQAAVREAQAGATPAESQLAGSGVALAAARRDQAQAQLELLQSGARPEQVRRAEVGVQQADLGVEQTQVQVALAQAAVTQAEAGLVSAQANVAAAEKALQRMTLRAPFNGRVGDLSVEVGEIVGPGVPVATLADLSGWKVETTDLTELDIVGVRLGLPVRVSFDALPGERASGVVTDIAAVSELVRGDVTYPVTIELESGTDLPLRWGMTAVVDIETES